ncbi:uncharacterized protein LOC134844384 [Symsagittifera roscoffensis]|uniref:uncharacterized protein LOC134844384 n=1 Tax=Symsagittifera roscoffensis TaxID=84072 RepID=UPI00307C9500
MFCQSQFYGKLNRGWWMIGAGILQLICILFLATSMATVEYKHNNFTQHGQFMVCPGNGPPGCQDTKNLAMLRASQVCSAVQMVLAVGICSYLLNFGVLVLTRQAAYYFSVEVHHHVYNFVILLSGLQLGTGFFGPTLCTWTLNEEMDHLHWGYSMVLHWVQLLFSLLSYLFVFLAPLYSRREDFAGVDEVMKTM